MGQTIAEKILSSRNLAAVPVRAGDLIEARVDGLMVHNSKNIRNTYKKMGFHNGPPVVYDNSRVFHMSEPREGAELAQINYNAKLDARRLGIKNFYDTEPGISIQMMLDYGHVRPGELVIGDDSHVTALGAVNSAATGVGANETAYVWAFGELFFTVPQTIKVRLEGKQRLYPFGKDVILYIAGKYGESFAQNHSLEFHGSFAAGADMTTRITLADHSLEVGAKFGIFMADEKTDEYIRARSGQPYEAVAPDPDADYFSEIVVDCDELDFQVAKPFSFDNVSPVKEIEGIRIDQARIGSCANGQFEDIEVAAKMLDGKKIAPGVRMLISPASMTVYKQCAAAGLIETLIEAGAHFEPPGCSICQSPGVVLNEEVCISSTTRNYRGRMGGMTCSEAQIYLAGPATVAASAIAGEIVHPGEFLRV